MAPWNQAPPLTPSHTHTRRPEPDRRGAIHGDPWGVGGSCTHSAGPVSLSCANGFSRAKTTWKESTRRLPKRPRPCRDWTLSLPPSSRLAGRLRELDVPRARSTRSAQLGGRAVALGPPLLVSVHSQGRARLALARSPPRRSLARASSRRSPALMPCRPADSRARPGGSRAAISWSKSAKANATCEGSKSTRRRGCNATLATSNTRVRPRRAPCRRSRRAAQATGLIGSAPPGARAHPAPRV